MQRDITSRQDEDTTFLLAKELATSVLKGDVEALTPGAQKSFSRADMYAFSNAINIADIGLDEKICSKVTTSTNTKGRCYCDGESCNLDDLSVREAYNLGLFQDHSHERLHVTQNFGKVKSAYEKLLSKLTGYAYDTVASKSQDLIDLNFPSKFLKVAAKEVMGVLSKKWEEIKLKLQVPHSKYGNLSTQRETKVIAAGVSVIEELETASHGRTFMTILSKRKVKFKKFTSDCKGRNEPTLWISRFAIGI